MRPASLLACALIAFGAGACGSNAPDKTAAPAEAVSKRQYVARSGAICERTGQKAGEQFKRIVGAEGPPPPGEEQRYLAKAQRFLKEAAIPIIRENVDARRTLRAPEGDEQQIDAIIAAGEKALTGFEEVAADRSRVRALFEGKIPTRTSSSTRSAGATASTSAAATSDAGDAFRRSARRPYVPRRPQPRRGC